MISQFFEVNVTSILAPGNVEFKIPQLIHSDNHPQPSYINLKTFSVSGAFVNHFSSPVSFNYSCRKKNLQLEISKLNARPNFSSHTFYNYPPIYLQGHRLNI